GAEKFLVSQMRYWPVDTDLRQPWRFGFEIYGIYPQLVQHNEAIPSGISSNRTRSRLRRGIAMPSPRCWTGNPLHTPEGAYFNIRKLGLIWWVRCAWQNGKRRMARMVGLHANP